MNEIIISVLVKWAHKICQDVYAEWYKIQNIEGKAEIEFAVIESTMDMIVGQFKASGQKAFIAEYGRGSLMQPADLSGYRQTEYWNRYRKNKEIAGRAQGVYRDIDGNTYYSSGANRGKNLEVTKKPEFQPIAPRDTIRKIVANTNSEFWVGMKAELATVLKSYVISVIVPKGSLRLKV